MGRCVTSIQLSTSRAFFVCLESYQATYVVGDGLLASKGIGVSVLPNVVSNCGQRRRGERKERGGGGECCTTRSALLPEWHGVATSRS